MLKKQPIAIFDSGYGGLTIFKEIQKLLPEYDYLYLGDNARNPYGTHSFEVVYKYTLQAVKKLFELDTYLIIIACNTASAKSLRNIQQNDLPKIDKKKRVLGVIRPSVEKVGEITKTNHVGILGTNGTIRSNSYKMELKKLYPHIKVAQEACPIWVPLVENNEFNTPGGHFFIKKNLQNLLEKDKNIDAIILGCTHYPILMPIIKQYISPKIKIIAQGRIVAEKLKDYLHRHPEIEKECSKNSSISFLTTESIQDFEEKAGIFLNTKLKAKQIQLT